MCITSLVHQWILCSEWVPSEWRVQKADKDIINRHLPQVNQLTSCEVKSCKQIYYEDVLASDCCLLLKCPPSIILHSHIFTKHIYKTTRSYIFSMIVQKSSDSTGLCTLCKWTMQWLPVPTGVKTLVHVSLVGYRSVRKIKYLIMVKNDVKNSF